MKFWAYHPDGVVWNVEQLADDVVPGKDVFTEDHAKDMTDVTALDPRPAERWTTADGGKTFTAPAIDMETLRQAAFSTAMAYGNNITAKVTGTYSDVEARTWPLQRAQADTVLGGGELPPDALLLKLAQRRGMAVEAFALLVQAKAQQFEAIADVGQGLRLGAEGLLSADLDTPAKLDVAVDALRTQALAAAGALGLAA